MSDPARAALAACEICAPQGAHFKFTTLQSREPNVYRAMSRAIHLPIYWRNVQGKIPPMKINLAAASMLFFGVMPFALHGQNCRDRKSCEDSCRAGVVMGCIDSAHAYLSGGWWQIDTLKAKELNRQACALDKNGFVCYEIGWQYQTGYQSPRDVELADSFYQLACDKGEQQGCTEREAMKRCTEPVASSPKDFAEIEVPAPSAERPSLKELSCDALVDPARHPRFIKTYLVTEPPKLIFKVDPIYPETARRKKVEGKVFLEIVVDEDGIVKDARVLRADDEILIPPSLEAVKQWKYQAAQNNGRPVRTYKNVTLVFSLH
jgi:TonB family protein